jgi:hypothetical protein
MEFAVVVEGNGDTNDKSIRERQISARVADDTEILLSLTTIKNIYKLCRTRPNNDDMFVVEA